jgi:hypothetical protein
MAKIIKILRPKASYKTGQWLVLLFLMNFPESYKIFQLKEIPRIVGAVQIASFFIAKISPDSSLWNN